MSLSAVGTLRHQLGASLGLDDFEVVSLWLKSSIRAWLDGDTTDAFQPFSQHFRDQRPFHFQLRDMAQEFRSDGGVSSDRSRLMAALSRVLRVPSLFEQERPTPSGAVRSVSTQYPEFFDLLMFLDQDMGISVATSLVVSLDTAAIELASGSNLATELFLSLNSARFDKSVAYEFFAVAVNAARAKVIPASYIPDVLLAKLAASGNDFARVAEAYEESLQLEMLYREHVSKLLPWRIGERMADLSARVGAATPSGFVQFLAARPANENRKIKRSSLISSLSLDLEFLFAAAEQQGELLEPNEFEYRGHELFVQDLLEAKVG